MTVRIERAASVHPPHRITAEMAVCALAEVAGSRRAAALARGSGIEARSVALPPAELWSLDGIEERNDAYRRIAPGLGLAAARGALGRFDPGEVGMLATSSCTGYALPGWGVEVAEELTLPPAAVRLPITEAGCAGGVLALARAADYLAARPGAAGLVVSVEICSLSFRVSGGGRDDGYLTSAMLFGDGAGGALLRAGRGAGLEIVDSSSTLIPGSRDALGYDLTGQGFHPVLRRELVDLLPPASLAAATELCERTGIGPEDIGAWLFHPGGPRILAALERGLGIAARETRWSWESMREHGNTSSAAIFDVLRRYLEEPRPAEWALVAAFGPGVSIEMLLVRRCS
jgi:alkylresorcinol/alkylpyrone synthase